MPHPISLLLVFGLSRLALVNRRNGVIPLSAACCTENFNRWLFGFDCTIYKRFYSTTTVQCTIYRAVFIWYRLYNLRASLFGIDGTVYNLQASLFGIDGTVYNLQAFLFGIDGTIYIVSASQRRHHGGQL